MVGRSSTCSYRVRAPPEHLPFESDVRFMSGEFVGADGRNHHGAFAFI